MCITNTFSINQHMKIDLITNTFSINQHMKIDLYKYPVLQYTTLIEHGASLVFGFNDI